MQKQKLVLVGNGMAGVRTLEELLKIASDKYDITVFGAEPHPNYNRILLSPVLGGNTIVNVPRFRLDLVLEALVRHRVSVFTGGPSTVYHALMGLADIAPQAPGHLLMGGIQ